MLLNPPASRGAQRSPGVIQILVHSPRHNGQGSVTRWIGRGEGKNSADEKPRRVQVREFAKGDAALQVIYATASYVERKGTSVEGSLALDERSYPAVMPRISSTR